MSKLRNYYGIQPNTSNPKLVPVHCRGPSEANPNPHPNIHNTDHLESDPRWTADVLSPRPTKCPPCNSIIIRSHHFFRINCDIDKDQLILKCRLVLHGNRNLEKDSIRSDCVVSLHKGTLFLTKNSYNSSSHSLIFPLLTSGPHNARATYTCALQRPGRRSLMTF